MFDLIFIYYFCSLIFVTWHCYLCHFASTITVGSVLIHILVLEFFFLALSLLFINGALVFFVRFADF